MDIRCPQCRSAIGLEDVNVSKDIALCRSCGKIFSFSEIAVSPAIGGGDLNAPVAGAWFEQIPGGFRTGATTRSWRALFLVPFTCVWAGMSVGSIYGKQLMSGRFNPTESFMGLPFLIGSIFLVGWCAMNLVGKVEVTQNGDRLMVFTGVGSIGWTRNFSFSDFNSVREDRSGGRYGINGRQSQVILLEGKRRATFGSMLSEERRYFLLNALRKMLGDPNRLSTDTLMTAKFKS